MNEKEIEELDHIFYTIQEDLPADLKFKLLSIPRTEARTSFWEWSWGLPMIVLSPTILWLFMKNIEAIDEYIVKLLSLLNNISIPSVSYVIFIISLGVITFLVCLGVFLYTVIEDKIEYAVLQRRAW